MASTRAKMKVTSIEGSNVKLECQYNSADTKEDQSFSHATPSGSMQLNITNPEALGLFKAGQYCYIDITPIADNDHE